MRGLFLLSLFCLIITACNRSDEQTVLSATPLQTQMPEASEIPSFVTSSTTLPVTRTFASTPTPTTTATTTPFITPTRTPKPYLIRFEYGAGDGVDEVDICMGSYTPYPQFQLYEDGQLILKTPEGYMVTTLSESEIQDLLTRIELTGFFEIKNHNGIPQKSGIYNLPPGITFGDGGWGKAITVKGRYIWIHPELDQYVVKPVEDAIDIVQKFIPKENLLPYIPDQLEVFVLGKKTGYFPETIPSSGVWPEELPSLDTSYDFTSFWISDKKTIQYAIQLKVFTRFPEMNVFTQDGVDYFVVACPIMDRWW